MCRMNIVCLFGNVGSLYIYASRVEYKPLILGYSGLKSRDDDYIIIWDYSVLFMRSEKIENKLNG